MPNTLNLFKKQFGFIFISSIMFIASFLWRDLLKDIEDMYFPKDSLVSRFLYTILITVALVVFIIYLKQFFGLNNDLYWINADITSEPDNQNEIDAT